MGRQSIFITGGTGYIGSRLIPLLAQRDHSVCALVRKGSEPKLPAALQPKHALQPAATNVSG